MFSGRDPERVLPGLYLGSIDALNKLEEIGATRVLSLLNFPPPVLKKGILHKHVNVADDAMGNLIDFLPDCVAFIEDAMGNKAPVLVHCHAGMSRSASAVLAYMMKTAGVGYSAALTQLREAYPAASPNAGFQEQLEMFASMGFVIDPSNPTYRTFSVKRKSRRFFLGSMEDGELREGPSSTDAATGQETLYRCRKCSRLLATSKYLMPASPASLLDRSSNSVFMEPMRWMNGINQGNIEGKIYCPQCNSRLGSFNWAGIQDEHGTWFTPAFQLHLSRLDEVKPVPASTVSKLRQPKILQNNSKSAQQDDTEQKELPKFFDYFIFDCDGVLVDTERASCESLRQGILAVTGFDIPHSFPEDYYPVFGMDIPSCVSHYKTAFNRSDWNNIEEIAEKVAVVKEASYKELTKHGIQPFKNVVSFIEELNKAGVPVGIGSSGSPEKIEHNLTSAGLIHLVPKKAIVSAKQVARGKPAPDVYIEALRRLGCTNPSSAVVIEDAIHGLKAAKGAGAFAIGITNSLPRDQLQEHANLVIDSMREMEKFIPQRNEN